MISQLAAPRKLLFGSVKCKKLAVFEEGALRDDKSGFGSRGWYEVRSCRLATRAIGKSWKQNWWQIPEH